MPLHLLGKKSWNIYNPENIARVRKDEAEAKAREATRERLERENEGARRLQLLRSANSSEPVETETSLTQPSAPDCGRSRKRKRLAGENDTDRDLRHAREDLARHQNDSSRGSGVRTSSQEALRRDVSCKGTSEREQGMRLGDAAGSRQDGWTPWYTSSNGKDITSSEAIGRDVWGNADLRRHEREQQRISTNDPLLAMKKGVKQLRENEKQKKDWMAQRERDLNEVEELAKENSKHRKRRPSDESLENFNLDTLSNADKGEKGPDRDLYQHQHGRSHHRHHHHRHRHRHKDRSQVPSEAPHHHETNARKYSS